MGQFVRLINNINKTLRLILNERFIQKRCLKNSNLKLFCFTKLLNFGYTFNGCRNHQDLLWNCVLKDQFESFLVKTPFKREITYLTLNFDVFCIQVVLKLLLIYFLQFFKSIIDFNCLFFFLIVDFVFNFFIFWLHLPISLFSFLIYLFWNSLIK